MQTDVVGRSDQLQDAASHVFRDINADDSSDFEMTGTSVTLEPVEQHKVAVHLRHTLQWLHDAAFGDRGQKSSLSTPIPEPESLIAQIDLFDFDRFHAHHIPYDRRIASSAPFREAALSQNRTSRPIHGRDYHFIQEFCDFVERWLAAGCK